MPTRNQRLFGRSEVESVARITRNCRFLGGAEVSPLHANYFINTGNATAADVLKLMRTVQSRVHDKWGVRLEPEVKLIGATGSVIALPR